MKRLKLALVFSLCLSVFSASIAQAAMLCCTMQADSTIEATTNSVAQCHTDEASKDSDSTTQSCQNCQACLSNSVVEPTHQQEETTYRPISYHTFYSSFSSIELSFIDAPPKFSLLS